MKAIANRLTQVARMAALAFAVLAVGSAWAATPVAAWTDFRNLTSGNYTWTVGGDSSVDPNTGVLTIGSTGGVYMDISGIGSDNRSFSIAIEAEILGTYTSDKTLVDLIVNGSHVSVAANGTTIGQCWNTGALSGTAYGKSTFTAGRQLLTVTFQGASGQGTHSYIDGTQVAGHTGLMSSSGSVTHIGIGSYNKTGEVAEGLKIYSVRLYDSKLSASDVSTDCNTYGVADYVTTVSSDTTLEGSDLIWKAKDGTTSTTAPTSFSKLDIRGSGKVTSSSAFNAKMNLTSGVTFQPASVSSGAAFYGTGRVYCTAIPANTSWTDIAWTGTLTLDNLEFTNKAFSSYGNNSSTLELSGVYGYITERSGQTVATVAPTLKLTNGNNSFGFKSTNGWSDNYITIRKLIGSGKFMATRNPNGNSVTQHYLVQDGSEFSGSIDLGERSMAFGSTTSKTSNKIVVDAGQSLSIGAGESWTSTVGTFAGVQVNGTVILTSTSTLGGTVTGSGTIVGAGSENVPNIASLTQSGWTGTVEVSGAQYPGSVVGSASTQFMNSGSKFKVTSGYVCLTSATGLTGTVSINSGAGLIVTDDTTTELSFGLGTVESCINLLSCSALTSLAIDVGTERSITASKLQLPPSSTLATVNVVVGEEHGNGGSITLTNTTGLPAVDGRTYNYLVKREDGVTVSAKLEDGVLTYTPAISGAATMYDATFLNTTDFAYKKSSDANIGLDTALNPKYNNELNDATTGIYIRHHPYVNGAASDIHGLTDFTLVVVGQMSPTHKTQFIHIGSTTSSNKGLLIATTENDDEVIIAPNTGKTVDTSNAVTVSVPNAASARHAYVIIKSGSVFTVWVDGIKRGNFTVAAGWEIGASDHAGVQVGSDFGGEIQRSSDTDKYSAVANSLDETGVVNVIRIFDYVVSDAQAEAIVAAYPYISEGGLYTRTISADANLSVANAWAKDGSDTTYALPEGATVEEVYYAPSATVTVAADATLTVNADVTIDTLTVGGVGDLAVASDGTHAVTVSGAAVVNSPLSITYGAVNLAGTPVQLGSGGTLHFDCSGIGLSEVYATTRYQLTGLMDRNDAKVTATLPTAVVRSATLEYNSNGYYELVVTPDHEAGSSIYYISGEFSASSSDLVVQLEGGAQTIPFPGDTVVFTDAKATNSSVTFGDTTPADVNFSFVDWTGTVNLPATALSGFNFNNYGVTGSKVVVTGDMTGWIAADVTFAPEIQLDADLTINDASSYPYTFTKISGSGNLSFSTKNYQPSSVTINLLDGYSGTITSTLETPVTILAYTSPFVPAASVTKDDVTKYYISVADAMKAAGTDAATITLLGDSSANITLALGQTLDVGSTTYTGTVSVTGTNVERASSGTTYVAVDNSSNAWKSGVTSGNWTEAANWEKGVVPNTYTAVTFPSGTCAVTISGEISLKSLTTGGATFTGGTFNCQAADSISGTMRGSVTVEYPAGAEPTGSTWTDPAWEGTLVLNACGFVATQAEEPYPTPFHLYGSTASTIKAPGFRGYAALQNASENVCQAELVIDENTTVEFNHGFKDNGPTADVDAGEDVGYFFSKLSGAGELKLDGDTDRIQYVFKNATDFTGSVTITDPTPNDFTGGKKSFVFGDSDNLDWTINDTDFPAYLVIDGDLTVAAGTAWTVPAGIVVVAGKTLTLADTSSVSLISKDSEGTVAVAAGATASINDVEDEVITGNIAIPATGTLNISDTAVETLTLSCQNSGALNLSGCTKLKTLYLDFSNNPTFDFNGLTLPNTCTTIYLDVGTKRDLTGYDMPVVAERTVAYYAQETAAEYGGTTGVIFTNVGASIGKITLRRFSGTIVTADQDPSVSSQRTYAGGAQFAGAACWHEWDFEGNNGLNDTGKYGIGDLANPNEAIALEAYGETYTTVTISSRNETKKAVSTSSKPHAGVTFGDTWSAAVRCSMPTVSDKVAVAFGSTSTGVLGLANVGGDVVQLFSWKPNDAARTILAQLKVEKPSVDNNMHIYVFVVTTQDNKKYVEFYRDGEFIHKSELNFTTPITTFSIGAIPGTTVDGLPAAATDGNTDYVRLFDRALDADTIAAISARRPFVSAKETYLREVSVGSVPEWSAAGEWMMTKAGGTADCPEAGENVTVTSPGGVGGALDVNLSADAKYDTLIFSGSGDIVVSRGENAGKIGADMLVVRTGIDLTVAYDAVNFSDTSVGVDDGATLRFNLSNYSFESVTTTTDVQLTGVVVAKEYDSTVANRISVVGAPDTGFFTVEPKWGTDNCFYATITRNYKTFTVDVPANTVVTVDGVSYEAATPISKKYGDEVTITYTADGAFVASGTQEQIVVVGSGTGATIHAPNDYTTTAAVAYDGTTYYTTFESAMTGAPADATVTLLADVTLTEHVYRTAPVVIDGANHSISFSKTDLDVSAPHDYNNYPFYIEPASQSGVVTVSNLIINAVGGRYAFIVDYADTTLENVTINANGCTGFCKEFGGSTVLKGVNIYNRGSNSDTFRNTAIGLAAGASVDVVSGTYTSENGWSLYIFTSGGTLNVYDGTFSGKVTSSVEGNHSYRTDANLNIYGGTFENCVLNVSQSGNYHVASMAVSGGSFNAPVPLAYCAAGKIPATISDGVYGVQDGWVITFDVEGVETQAPTAAGATPAYTGTPAKAEDDEYTYTFAGWTPTIVEATETATYTATFTPVAKFVTFTVVVPENTVATVTGATPVEGNTYRAAVNAEVTITYAADGAYVASGTKTQTVTPTAGQEIKAPTAYEITPAVAQVGANYYATLAEAASSVADGGTITMLADHNVGAERIQVSEKSYTVELNGTTLSSSEEDAIIFRVSNGKTITINGTVEGSTVVGSVMIAGGTEGHIVVNGGIYENDLYCPFYANGTCFASSTIAITGATIIANDTEPADSDAETGFGLYQAGPATVTITGTTITAVKTGVEVRAGNLTIEDAIITANGDPASATANGNGGTVVGAAIAVSPHNTNKAIALTVNSGTFTGVKAIYENYLENKTRTATTAMSVTGGSFNGAVESQNVTGFISGGTFDADVPLAYCATGKVPVEVSEGGYTVVSGWVVTFVNYDDSVLEVQRVPANETPAYTGATPTKEATTQNSYEFNGWAPEVVAATATATYQATYTEIASLVTITVPEVAGAIATVTVSDGDIISSGNTYTVKPGVTVTVTWTSNGAYIITNGSTSFTAEGDVTVGTDVGTLPTVTPAVAQIQGGSYYASLKAAVDAAQAGDTVTLLKDCEGAGIFVGKNADKEITIDFGGFTYTVVTPVGSPNTVNQMLHLEAGNTVTLANGRIEATDDPVALAAFEMVMQNYCDLTIDGMEIDGTGIAVAVYSAALYQQKYPTWYMTDKPQFNYNGTGTSVIRASTITLAGDVSIDDSAALTIEDDVVINANKIVTKGTDDRYASATPTITVENGAKFSFDCAAILADDQKVVEEDGVYTVTGKTYVAQIGTTKFNTLADAIAAANVATGAVTIELLSDLDFSEEVYAGYKWAGATYNPLTIVKSNVTLDLGGHTISNMGNCALVFGNLLAKDGRIANCAIRNGTLVAGTTGGVVNSYVLGIAGVDGMTVEGITTLGGINVYTASTGVVIDGCTVQGTKYYTVCAQCGSEVTIRGTTYTKNTDSTVANKSMFWIQGAGSDSDLVTTGNPTGAFGTSIISIEGGDFTVDTTNGGVFYLASGVTPTVSGGTFNIPVPANCCAVGFEPVGEAAPYTVKVKEAAAVVTTTDTITGEVVTNAVLELSAEATTAILSSGDYETVEEALVAEDSNGLKKWENYVLDIDTTSTTEEVAAPAVQAAASDTKDEAKLNLSFTPKAASTTGVKVSYKVDTVTVNNGVATTNRADSATAAPAVKLDDLKAGKTKYVTVRAVLTSSTGTETEVEVQKVVGVMAVNSTQQNTIVAVPWESFNGNSITANELVYTGNRTAGDTLTVYVPATGKYKTWKLVDGAWGEVQTYSLDANGNKANDSAGDPADQLIPRGAGVWVYRQDVTEKIYLLGQKPETETATVTVEKGYNLVAPVVTDSNQTTIEVNEVVPVAEEEVAATANDKVLIPVAGKAPYNLYYNAQEKAWGYDRITVDGFTVTKTFVKEVSIPTGTGFWYISGANGNKDITIGTESTTQE